MQKAEKSQEKKIRPMALTIKAVVVNEKGQVLLLKRAKDCMNGGKWDLPGGHVDAGETLEEALKREVKEEADIDVTVGPVIRLSEFEKDHEAFQQEKRGLRYLAFNKNGQVKLNPKEHDQYQWLSIDDAISLLGDEGFEQEKKETILAAKEYLEMKLAMEGWRRALADLDNFRKRTEKANEDYRKYCLDDIVLELLPVVDNFEMAAAHIPAGLEKDGWVAGLMHIKNQLETVLRNRGVEEIPTKPGDRIDVSIHEVFQGEGKKDKIKKIVKKGFRMGERVIRPVMVETE